ncbi:hypothetical protein KC19_8G025600 [Ceratodon purpureus]|uniref:Uncharacterized protein n=1 Tax=Ceratodon purpureus TaxID=3225 RepID=A0A8T0GWU0_CERPU|nr:hypothetical protein KC19_8G025600 [Ceratodon purpureus]
MPVGPSRPRSEIWICRHLILPFLVCSHASNRFPPPSPLLATAPPLNYYVSDAVIMSSPLVSPLLLAKVATYSKAQFRLEEAGGTSDSKRELHMCLKIIGS